MNNCKTVILHLSDLHFGCPIKRTDGIEFCRYSDTKCSENAENPLRKFIDGFPDFIRNNPNLSPNVLVISGDIAWNGSKQNYDEAECFFNDLLHESKIRRSNVLICVGNHDVDAEKLCDTDLGSKTHKVLDRQIGRVITRQDPNVNAGSFMPLRQSDVEDYYYRFRNIEKFCKKMRFKTLLQVPKSRHYAYAYGARTIKNIDFICLNTEWDFWGGNDKHADSCLRIGKEIYCAANQSLLERRPFINERNPRVVVYHRSIDYWHKEELCGSAQEHFYEKTEYLIRQNDIALIGHDHNFRGHEIGGHTKIYAGTLYNSDLHGIANFSCNFISIPRKIATNGTTECELYEYAYHLNSKDKYWALRSRQIFHIFRVNEENEDDIKRAVDAYINYMNSSNKNTTEKKRLHQLIKSLSDNQIKIFETYITTDAVARLRKISVESEKINTFTGFTGSSRSPNAEIELTLEL